jgi:hypothetical protein
MTIALGVGLVLLAIAFVLLPLFQKDQAAQIDAPDPAVVRAGLYRQILDAELDARLGKLEGPEYEELRVGLLREAAALIVASDGGLDVNADVAARVEDEIAAARAAMYRKPSMPGLNA